MCFIYLIKQVEKLNMEQISIFIIFLLGEPVLKMKMRTN